MVLVYIQIDLKTMLVIKFIKLAFKLFYGTAIHLHPRPNGLVNQDFITGI